jgi:glutamate synthase (NADPH) small chain
MGKVTGFLEWSRQGPPKRDKVERLADWNEVYRTPELSVLREQGGRCMDCGVPFCQQGCPLGNHIPDWNDLVFRDRWRDAYRWLSATNNFPEFTGRLCPAPCEAACVLSINTDAVTIEEIEKQIIERAFAEGWVQPEPRRPSTGKKVAIVGSGPAGLAAAEQLCRAGHQAIVYEADDRLGGMLRYGIPDFKMEKWVIDRRLAILEAAGVEFRTGVRVGETITWDALRHEHDAVLATVGAQKHRDIDVPGREQAGICFAMDYLTQQNRVVAGDPIDPAERLDAAGKHVIILGGGDTGSDCLGTALRQGAKSVKQIQLWPAPPAERAEDNPWPQWPLVFQVSTSQEEGGEREWGMMTKRLSGRDGRIDTLHGIRIDLQKQVDRKQAVEIPGSELEMPCDLLILAIGFQGPKEPKIAEQLGVAVDARGNLTTDERFATNVEGVYAAGDAMRGASLIVWAIADGREAARHIDSYLREGAAPQLPTKGADCTF